MSVIHLEIAMLWVVMLGMCVLSIRQIRADMRMHQAHAKMINLLLDDLIERKKGEVVQAVVDKYRQDIKVKPKGVVH